ncbi:MAG TPA: histidine kinase dimerization/phospho-acceptor domain-containing protein [Terriglobales bacterium]|nr:histidine kinase dimerization/phospho-acceptor domain-containing protein [Terriglobales bacterium]
MSAAASAQPNLRELCHALSQPLTAARGNLELALRMPPEDPARADFFNDALAALDRLMEIARQLNDAAEAAGR